MTDATRPLLVETLLAERAWVEGLARSLVTDDATAADVVQQTWLAAIERPPRSSPRGWLARVVRNAAFQSHRAASRRARHEADAVARASEPSPAETVARAEAHRRVVDAVMALDEPYRTAVLLRFFEGLESADVARRTGVPVETARTRIKRALALLRGRLDRDAGGDGRAWALAMAPLVAAGQRGTPIVVSTAAAGGAVMAGTMKAAVIAGLSGVLLGAAATAVLMTLRAPVEPPDREAAAAPKPGVRERRAERGPEAPTAADASPLARAIAGIAVELPPPSAASITGRVTAPDGTPMAGAEIRASAVRPSGRAVGARSVEDAVRDAAIDAKWREATTRTATCDASGAYSLDGLVDAPYRLAATRTGCTLAPVGRTAEAPVPPGATANFVVVTVDVPVTVLLPGATPALEKVLVRWRRAVTPAPAAPASRDGGLPTAFVSRRAGAASAPGAASWEWTPERPVVPIPPGAWELTAEMGDHRSPPTAVAVAAPTADAVTLRLEAGDTTKHRGENVVVPAALGWLVRRQRADGGWGDAGATGAALLSLLGAGETHQAGKHREQIANALARLAPDADGRLAPRDAPHFLRDHALAALALVEEYGMTGSKARLEPARRAVEFALAARASGGGWNLPAPRDAELDFEATVLMAMLLKSAQMSEIPTDPAALREVVAAIDRITDPATGRVTPPAGSSLSADAATAAGMVVRILAGRTARNDPALAAAASLLDEKLPTSDASGAVPDLAYCYFGTLAAFQCGGSTWTAWNKALQIAVLDRQRADESDEERGSWDPANAGATESDRVLTTALLTICTEVRFRYPLSVGSDVARPR
jgi:RNA polymerase sigma factor (sigma-70 family)